MTQENTTPLGQILTALGVIDQAQLHHALSLQKTSGARLGSILLAEGDIKPLPLHRALATQYGLPFVNLIDQPIDATLLLEEECYQYLAHRILPWKQEMGVVTLATCDITPSVLRWADTTYGKEHYQLAITSPRDIGWTIEKYFGLKLDEDSRNLLFRTAPQQSAKIVLPSAQKQTLFVFLILCISALFLFPTPFLLWAVGSMNLFYFLTLGLKLVLFTVGAHHPPQQKAPLSLSDRDLPIYTLLVPLYKEAASLPRLLGAIRALDYPHAKMDVKLIIEQDDTETLEAAKSLKPQGMFEIVRVPFSLPRTKPKACNYALRFARGDFVTVYDAEDAPQPRQLKEAIGQFMQAGEDTVCLQARLNYYNWSDNLLTRLFAIEYAGWFDFMLPGLQKLAIPIPLGGTSNHISLARLKALGEWDPYNVTEDADLGLRLAISKGHTTILPSYTMEEAPRKLWPWMKQRSRWIKGYMQTWLVHMRHPTHLYKNLGARGFWGFQFFVGGPPLVFLTAPFLWCISLLWLMGWLPTLSTHLPGWLLTVCIMNMVWGLAIHWAMAIASVKHWQWRGMALALLAFPFYWLLHSVASYRAVWQLLTRPHYWDKTTHGI